MVIEGQRGDHNGLMKEM